YSVFPRTPVQTFQKILSCQKVITALVWISDVEQVARKNLFHFLSGLGYFTKTSGGNLQNVVRSCGACVRIGLAETGGHESVQLSHFFFRHPHPFTAVIMSNVEVRVGGDSIPLPSSSSNLSPNCFRIRCLVDQVQDTNEIRTVFVQLAVRGRKIRAQQLAWSDGGQMFFEAVDVPAF